jgi:DNA-binding response OmpR family regulator
MNTQFKLLLVEDDKVLGKNLKERLEKENYQVDWVKTLKDCEDIQAKWGSYDLVIFDVTLPDGSGFDLAKKLKKQVTVPFLFMTALHEAESRLQGYEIGAEEFIPKPFHLKELLIRIAHVLSVHVREKVMKIKNFSIDFKSMKIVHENGEETTLALNDFKILKYLIDVSPRAVSRDELMDKVWGQDEFPSPRTIDNVMVRLRQYLRDENSELIKSVRGLGYRWQGEQL